MPDAGPVRHAAPVRRGSALPPLPRTLTSSATTVRVAHGTTASLSFPGDFMSRAKRTQSARTTRPGSRRQAPLPGLSQARATSASAPESWHVPARLDALLPDGISGECFSVPEGVVDVVRCRHCGGRNEHLTVSKRSASEATAHRSGQLTARRHIEFAAHHAQCAIAPRVYRPLPDVAAFADFLIAEATEILRMGDGVQQAAYMMHGSGMADFDYPPSSPGHAGNESAYRVSVAELHREVRHCIRENALSVQAIAHVGTCWVSADPRATNGAIGAKSAPDRAEALAITVVTPSDGRLLHLPIAPVADERLAALLRVPKWRALSQAAPLTDGLFATTT